MPWVHRTTCSAVATLALALILGALGTGTAQAAAVPDPVPPATLGVAEGFSPYLPQVSCDPVTKPGTDALRSLLMATYGGRDLGITRGCEIGALSEHKEGRAWDWGLSAAVPAEKALAQQFLGWLTAPGPNGMAAANARRLGVMYVIWNGKIWSAYRASEGWRAYSGGESHAGHIHISLAWNGAMKRTSWWTGNTGSIDYGPCVAVEGDPAPKWTAPRATPCPAPISAMSLTGTPLLARESTGAYVVQLQRLLKVTPVTGFFGPITESAVTKLQTDRGLPVTGTTTPATWAAARNPLATSPPPAPDAQPVVAARSLPATMRYTVRAGDSLSAHRGEVGLDGRGDQVGEPAAQRRDPGRPGDHRAGPLGHHQVHLHDPAQGQQGCGRQGAADGAADAAEVPHRGVRRHHQEPGLGAEEESRLAGRRGRRAGGVARPRRLSRPGTGGP